MADCLSSFTVEPGPPAYLYLSEEEWQEKLERSRDLANPCVLCGRRCRARRLEKPENKGQQPDLEYAKHVTGLWLQVTAPISGKNLPLSAEWVQEPSFFPAAT